MSANVREREVEGYLRKRVEAVGGVCEKFLPDLDSGMPDRIVMLPGGVLVWVETKKPKGGQVSPIQKYQHGRLRKLGQAVEVVWTKAQADALIAHYLGPPGEPSDSGSSGERTSSRTSET